MTRDIAIFLYGSLAIASLVLSTSFAASAWELTRPGAARFSRSPKVAAGLALNFFTLGILFVGRFYTSVAFPAVLDLLTPVVVVLLGVALGAKTVLAWAVTQAMRPSTLRHAFVAALVLGIVGCAVLVAALPSGLR